MNKKIFIISSVLILTLAITGTTLGLLKTESQVKVNVFVPGVLKASIMENDTLPLDNTNILTPSDKTVCKKLQVENISGDHGIDAYIRVMLVPKFITPEGSLAGNISLSPSCNAISITGPKGESVNLNLISGWEENWIYDNGCFYHKNKVGPGQKTEILLESVTVSDPKLWDTFNLEVLSDSIQAESGAAKEAWGAISDKLNN